MPTLTLARAPRLAPLYARAALSALPLRPRRGDGGVPDLPDLRLALADVAVDPGALAAYDRVCGFVLRDVLPPTYPHVLAFPLHLQLMSDRAFPLALPGLVHVRNVLTQHRPLRLGETLTVCTYADRLAAHPRGTSVDLVTEVDADGARAWVGRSTYLARSGRPGRGHRPAPREPDLQVEGIPSARWRVPADTGRRYAAVSGDVNPIHLSPLAARALGFPRAIAHGMWTAARVLAALEPRLPQAFTADVAFRKPLLLPATVQLAVRGADGGWDVGLLPVGSPGAHLLGTVRAPS